MKAYMYIVCFLLFAENRWSLADAFTTNRSNNPGRWHSPCGSSDSHVTTVPFSVPQVLERLRKRSLSINRSAEELLNLYATRITAPSRREELDKRKWPAEWQIKNSSSAELTEKLIHHYQNLSIFAVFLEKMAQDKINYGREDVVGNITDTIKNKLYDILCDLYTGIYQVLHGSIPSFVSRTVIPTTSSRTEVFERDYTVVRNLIKTMVSLAEMYKKMYKALL